MNQRARAFILLVFAVVTAFAMPSSQSKEYLIKTAYIEKFARFTEWPPEAEFNDFVIGVIGKSSFGGSLELFASDYKIKNKKVRIKYFNLPDEIIGCNLLFICASEKNRLSEILEAVAEKPILSVGDSKGFAEKGVHFNFYLTDKGTIHFEVNPMKILQSGLKCDMFLLGVGKIIN